jgi:hypothetical protein
VAPVAAVGAPPRDAPAPLPEPALVVRPAGGFHIALPLRVPYADLNRGALAPLVGTTIDVGTDTPVRVAGVQACGSGARLILELAVTGPVTATFYVAGTPAVSRSSSCSGARSA